MMWLWIWAVFWWVATRHWYPLEILGKGNTDLVGCGKIQGVVGRKGLDDVVIASPLCLVEPQLHRLEFLHSGLR